MAKFIVGSAIGEKIDFDNDVCVFCSDVFDEKHPSVTPDLKSWMQYLMRRKQDWIILDRNYSSTKLELSQGP